MLNRSLSDGSWSDIHLLLTGLQAYSNEVIIAITVTPKESLSPRNGGVKSWELAG